MFFPFLFNLRLALWNRTDVLLPPRNESHYFSESIGMSPSSLISNSSPFLQEPEMVLSDCSSLPLIFPSAIEVVECEFTDWLEVLPLSTLKFHFVSLWTQQLAKAGAATRVAKANVAMSFFIWFLLWDEKGSASYRKYVFIVGCLNSFILLVCG